MLLPNFRFLFSAISPFKRDFILLLITTVFAVLSEGVSVLLILPVFRFIQKSSEDVETSSAWLSNFLQPVTIWLDQDTLFWVVIFAFLLLLLVVAGFQIVNTRMASSLEWKWQTNRMNRLMETYIHMDYLKFTQHHTGTLLSTVFYDTRFASMCIKEFIMLFTNGFLILVLLSILVLTNPAVSLFFFGGMAAMIFFGWKYLHRFSVQAGKKTIGLKEKLHQEVKENLAGIRLVRYLGIEEARLKSFSQDTSVYARISSMHQVIQKIPRVLGPILLVIILTAYVASFQLTATGNLSSSFPGFFLFVVVAQRLSIVLSNMSANYMGFVKYYQNLKKMERLLADHHQPTKVSGLRIAEIKTIEIRDLAFGYSDDHLLFEDLNVQIPLNKIFVLLGPSGAGKSTLANLLLGYLTPTKGCVLINGLNLNEIDRRAYFDKLGFVSQFTVLFNLSIRENLLYAKPNATDKEMLEALYKANFKISESLKEEDLDLLVGDDGIHLSGGEKQRLSLAIAFLRNPEIILFDEPTSALDETTGDWIIDVLRSFKGAKTIIVITHNKKFASIADCVYSLSEGKLRSETNWNVQK